MISDFHCFLIIFLKRRIIDFIKSEYKWIHIIKKHFPLEVITKTMKLMIRARKYYCSDKVIHDDIIKHLLQNA